MGFDVSTGHHKRGFLLFHSVFVSLTYSCYNNTLAGEDKRGPIAGLEEVAGRKRLKQTRVLSPHVLI